MEYEPKIDQTLPSGLLKAIRFDILSEADAAKISSKVIGLSTEVTDPALGLPNPSFKCNTCGAEDVFRTSGIKSSKKDVKDCEGHFGLVNLPYTILNPYFMPEIAVFLNKICPGCNSLRRSKTKTAASTSGNCNYCDVKAKNYPPLKFKVSPEYLYKRTAITAEVKEEAVKKYGLAPDFWNIIPHDAQAEAIEMFDANVEPNIRVLSHAQVFSILKRVDSRLLEASFKKKSSIFLNCLLLTPNCHRVVEFGQDMKFDERNRHYKKLFDFKGTANDLSMRVLDCTKITKLRVERQRTTKESASSLKFVKELLIGKRSDYGFRMVVVGDPKIHLSEIGVPSHVAESLQIREHLNSWNSERLTELCDQVILQKGGISVRRNDEPVRVSSVDKLQKGDAVYRPLVDGDIVLINRPPSIHQHSLIALYVKVLPMISVVSINPLICSPLRGDFDGDCLHGYLAQATDAKVELKELVALNKQLTDGQSGRNLLSLSHDSLTAAHLILEDGVLLSNFQMQQLQMYCNHKFLLPSIIKALPTGSSCAWTGKQLFSMLLPSDFNYDFPPNSVLIHKGEVLSSSGSSWLGDSDGNLVQSLVRHYGEEAVQFLNSAQDVLCEWLSMRGLSISLSDIYLSDRDSHKNMIEEISIGLEEIERLSLSVDHDQDFLVQISEEKEMSTTQPQTLSRHNYASICAFKRGFKDVLSLFYSYARNDNSLMTMLKAGSKGNLQKAVQHSMCLGLQHPSVSLSFQIPQQHSSGAKNGEELRSLNVLEYSGAVVKNSFIAGLNPLECFVHSLSIRESSFSGHADVSGTLTRNLMFFMRDLYIAYDGTVRNAYANHIVQFSYQSEEDQSDTMGGHPVGSLAACALSEAAYSALDLPVSSIESSPLLQLKKVLESGVQKSSGAKSASLFLSKKLGRRAYGFEYGALAVKSYLERVTFSDVVSSSMICFSPGSAKRNSRSTWVSWVCHFHVNKEMARRKRLNMCSVTDALNLHYASAKEKAKAKIELPNVLITCEDCSVADIAKEDSQFCITAAIIENSRNPSLEFDILRGAVMPILLRTVIKGFCAFKKVEILWKDRAPVKSISSKSHSGELYLRVLMSENCARAKFWGTLVDSCVPIMGMIDWESSHPNDIHDISSTLGLDVAWNSFLSNLSSAVSDVRKTIVPEHLVLAADCLSVSGQFVGLNSKGLTDQRNAYCVSAPLSQACHKDPGKAFSKAAKLGLVDDLQGSADALSWGKVPSVGTGFKFDILFSGKERKPSEPSDVYSLLATNSALGGNSTDQFVSKRSYTDSEGYKNLLMKSVRKAFSPDDIKSLSLSLKNILKTTHIDDRLNDSDKTVVMKALRFHPNKDEKIGSGITEIKVAKHDKHDSRCFVVERSDGTCEDFSYHKCIQNALEIIAPEKAKSYNSRWLKGGE